MTSLCLCGKPLHYTDPKRQAMVTNIVDKLGEFIPVTTPNGSWYVPRHYIALHGIKANELPDLATKYSLKKMS